METVEDIVIVGADPAGLATAIGLHRRGVKSLVLESSATMCTSGYALGLWTNSWRALDALGIGDKLIYNTRPDCNDWLVLSSPRGTSAKISLRGVKDKSGKLEFRTVRRESLVEILAKELPGDAVRYSSEVVSIEEDGNLKLLHSGANSFEVELNKLKGSVEPFQVVVVGCDGINSTVVKYIGLKEAKFLGVLSTGGFVEYPTNHGNKPEFLVITGKGFHAGMLPCSERSIYWYFNWRPSKKDKIDQSMTKMRDKDFIIQKLTTSEAPKEIIQVIERSKMNHMVSSSLKSWSLNSILPEKITKKRNTCVIGEALNPLMPGLGLCTSLEESVVLVRYLSDGVHKGKIEKALKKFAQHKWKRCVELSTGASLVRFIVKSTFWLLRFRKLRMEDFWVMILATELSAATDYDCGKL
ncbi:FAD/NAD(P)-binding oxidoreductase family protein [Rhynchospora pubera]|uniref:FAD/NAD(P)-binding oxidoreductase family protein n=1 Tax=Rhynchospora pubera TaxID=906938 RepID=A0AAV8GIR5_9POAL|nr:FAD/NAD(P)-binding oxidoreductase family protein [Rhynchospora pubera]